MEKSKFSLNPYLKFILCSEDELLIKHGVRSNFSLLMKDENRKRLLGKTIKYFKSPTSLEELISKKMIKQDDCKDMGSLINLLYQKKVLIKPEKDIVSVYLKTILRGESELSQYTIGVIGAGYLGSRIIIQLLKLGIKKLVFYEERKVENTEIEMRYFDIPPKFFKEDKDYVEILQDYLPLLGFNEIKGISCRFDDEERINGVFKDADFIIVNSEFFSPKLFHTMNKTAISMKKPWITVYADGSQGIIGPTYIPGETLCYNEFEIQTEATIRLRDEYLLYKEYMEDEGIKNFNLVIPPLLDIISNFAVIFVINFLIKKYSPTVGRAIFINFEDFSIDFQEVLKLPRCPACEVTKPAYKHAFV